MAESFSWILSNLILISKQWATFQPQIPIRKLILVNFSIEIVSKKPIKNNNKNKYLARHYIKEYLNDSVNQLLLVKNTTPKLDVMEFFLE
jgi:hypothetical protein